MRPIASFKDQIGPNSINIDHLGLDKGDISGDYISGGVIENFSSTGIVDGASRPVMRLSNDAIVLTTGLKILDGNKDSILEIDANSIRIKRTLYADTFIETKRSLSPTIELKFDGSGLGSGLIVQDQLNSQSILYKNNNWEISDSFKLPANKSITIGKRLILSETELGLSVVRSNLKSLGVLEELRVKGEFSIGENLIYNPSAGRLGVNTIDPQGVLGLFENGVEFLIAGEDYLRGKIGTATKHDLHLVTNNTTVIKLTHDGNVTIGTDSKSNSKVSINHNSNTDYALSLSNTGMGMKISCGKEGKLVITDQITDSVTLIVTDNKLGVGVAKPEANLHVVGDVHLMGRHMYSAGSPPTTGTHRMGDIVWNSNPGPTLPIGWVCVSDGFPGTWAVFGRIESV